MHHRTSHLGICKYCIPYTTSRIQRKELQNQFFKIRQPQETTSIECQTISPLIYKETEVSTADKSPDWNVDEDNTELSEQLGSINEAVHRLATKQIRISKNNRKLFI